MGDLTLALMGVSAAVGSAAGWWAALWHRDRVPAGEQWIIRRIYKHVDDLIGATKTENQDRADRRRRIIQPRFKGWRRLLWLIPKKVRTAWADYREPIPRIGAGTNPLPEVERMAQYIQVAFRHVPTRQWLVRPAVYQLWNVEVVTVFWTSEAAALSGHLGENVGRKVAQALRLESVEQLDWTMDYDAGCIRYRRKGPAPEVRANVPHGVGADV